MPNSGYVAGEAALTCRASVSFPLCPSFCTPFGENGSVWPFGEVLSSPFHGAFCQSIDPWTASPQWTDLPEITDIWTEWLVQAKHAQPTSLGPPPFPSSLWKIPTGLLPSSVDPEAIPLSFCCWD